MALMKQYSIEREGQIDFFDNYGIPYEKDSTILVDNTDGIYNGNLLEFKLDIINVNKVLMQAIKYLSNLRIKGESVPATIILVDLNAQKAYIFKSENYRKSIQKVYVGAASKNNLYSGNSEPKQILKYSDMEDSATLSHILTQHKAVEDKYMAIDIDENCIVGWARRYYSENPSATKGDFIGDQKGSQVRITGEIRSPKHFKGLIRPYKGVTNEKFKYLMDMLNDRLSKKELGAFYTPVEYAKQSTNLILKAIKQVPKGNDYIILDRCAGTGNLEAALRGLKDPMNDKQSILSHCVVSTFEYYEYKVLFERLGQEVRDIIPPTEANVDYSQGKVLNADALSESYLNNAIIKKYIDDPKVTVIIFENPPYQDSSADTYTVGNQKNQRAKTNRNKSFIHKEFKKHINEFNGQQAIAREIANLFIWSGFNYYLRQPTDSYVLFSPIKYYKNAHIVNRKFIDGYAFNRKHFHATKSVVSCILWTNQPGQSNSITLKAFDILQKKCIRESNHDIHIDKVFNQITDLNDKRLFRQDIESTKEIAVVGSDGYERIGWSYSKGRKPKYNENIIGYLVSKSFMIDPKHYNLVRTNFDTALKNSYGFWLRKDNFIKELPLYVAKRAPFTKWYQKDVYYTTSDGGREFMRDDKFLKKCLIFTTLDAKNKCISFNGSDGRLYLNELCLDTTTDKDSLSIIELKKLERRYPFTSDEQNLIKLWKNILVQAQKMKSYNTEYLYGVYQIDKELNTFKKEVFNGKVQKKYDNPILNGYLTSLRNMLNEYYLSDILPDMFKYSLIK